MIWLLKFSLTLLLIRSAVLILLEDFWAALRRKHGDDPDTHH